MGLESFHTISLTEVLERQFIEIGRVPSDSQMVGKTWRYVNKKGGPDKHFRDNHELPVMRYEEILLSSRTGLRELFQLSRVGAGTELRSALLALASAINSPAPPRSST